MANQIYDIARAALGLDPWTCPPASERCGRCGKQETVAASAADGGFKAKCGCPEMRLLGSGESVSAALLDLRERRREMLRLRYIVDLHEAGRVSLWAGTIIGRRDSNANGIEISREVYDRLAAHMPKVTWFFELDTVKFVVTPPRCASAQTISSWRRAQVVLRIYRATGEIAESTWPSLRDPEPEARAAESVAKASGACAACGTARATVEGYCRYCHTRRGGTLL